MATEMHTKFWWGDLREGDGLEDLGLDWRIILFLRKENVRGTTGLICFRRGTSGWLLCPR